jgi:hypothetical protein
MINHESYSGGSCKTGTYHLLLQPDSLVEHYVTTVKEHLDGLGQEITTFLTARQHRVWEGATSTL